MRRALIVGINHYEWSPLTGCVNDAEAMAEMLARNFDDSPNFDCRLMVSDGDKREVTRIKLLRQIDKLFKNEAELALLFFSGHGASNDIGSYLVTQDARQYEEGVSMSDVMVMANQSKANEVIIIIDACHSGHLGNLRGVGSNKVILREGVSILTASRGSQFSYEQKGMGLFTRVLCEALEDGAADLLGNVNVSAAYSYVEMMFNSWGQRPVFKSHVAQMVPIRKTTPKIPKKVLRRLKRHFLTEKFELRLSPKYASKKKKHALFAKVYIDLMAYRSQGLLIAKDADSLYNAIINGKSCVLTPSGRYYWNLVKKGAV